MIYVTDNLKALLEACGSKEPILATEMIRPKQVRELFKLEKKNQ